MKRSGRRELSFVMVVHDTGRAEGGFEKNHLVHSIVMICGFLDGQILFGRY